MMYVNTRQEFPRGREFIEKVRTDLSSCIFTNSIYDQFLKGGSSDFFFAFDVQGKCVAGASVELHVQIAAGRMMDVKNLCSSKTCAGAGSGLLKYIESCARDNGMDFVGLVSTPWANAFYNKQGYVRVAGNLKQSANRAGATRRKFRRCGQFIKRVSKVKK